MRNKNKKKGFTLIEMLAAVVILGILAAIATIAIRRIIDNSRMSTFLGSFDNIITGIRADAMVGSVQTGEDEDTMVEAYNYSRNDFNVIIDDKGALKACSVDGAASSYDKVGGGCTDTKSEAIKVSCNYYRIQVKSKRVKRAISSDKCPSYANCTGGVILAGSNPIASQAVTFMDTDGVTVKNIPSECTAWQ